MHVMAFLVGCFIILLTLKSAVQTFILPRSASDPVARGVFLATRKLFDLRTRFQLSYEARDATMAVYAPVTLLVLIAVWLVLVCVGFACLFWTFGVGDWSYAFTLSGSSLFTLGFAAGSHATIIALTFIEAAIGLILIALLIGYLPTLYGAWSRREELVTRLEVRAGAPPTPIEMLVRYHRLGRLNALSDVWDEWEIWFSQIGETHTSLASLPFFRSPQSGRSWVVASGAILDAAALTLAIVDIPHDSQADICIRAGYVSLREIAKLFRLHYHPDPEPDHPISVTRAEFDLAYDLLAEQGVPLKPDRDQGWRDYAGWRVNYDDLLISLARLTMSPPAPWSSDRYLDKPVPVLNELMRTQKRR